MSQEYKTGTGRPVVSVHIDIADFAARVLTLPEGERGEWVTSLAVALSRKDPSKATHEEASSYAHELLCEACQFMTARSEKARKAGKARQKTTESQSEADEDDSQNSAKVSSSCRELTNVSITQPQSRADQSRPEHKTPLSPNGDNPPTRTRLPEVFPVPPALAEIPGFNLWWLKWIDHRKGKRSQLTKPEAELQLIDLMNQTDPVATIKHSIAGGCIRLRPPEHPASVTRTVAVAVPSHSFPPDYVDIDAAAQEAKKAFHERFGEPEYAEEVAHAAAD